MPVLDRNDHLEPRIAIVAADARTALGRDLDETWDALLEGRSAVSPVTGFDGSGFGEPCAAQVWPDAAGPEEDTTQRILGRHGQLVDATIRRVHEDAGLADMPRDRLGLYVSVGLSDTPIGDLAPAVLASRDDAGKLDFRKFFAGGFRQLHPLWPLVSLQNVAVGQTSIDLDIQGDNVVLSSEADEAVRAYVEAGIALADGAADVVLAAAGGESVSAPHLARLRLRGVLGNGPARPGSRTGDGCSPGEAAGAVALERESADGRRPLAFLLGGTTTFERAPDRAGPTEDAFRRAMAGALRIAGLETGDVDAVFLHAEGHAGQDAAEIRAVTDVLGTGPRLVATKGALGHAGGAAPAVDVALAVRTLTTGVLPPTVTSGPLLDGLESRLVDSPAQGAFRRILILAAGSHGSAGALVLEAAS